MLVVSVPACTGLTVTLPPATPAPTATVPPTPTTAPPQATPVPLAEPAHTLEAQVEAVYDHAGPAVVNITSRVITYDFFMQPIPQEGTGSGFVYDTEGHIVTNYHVVVDAESVSVALASGKVCTATIVGTDPSNDLAVIRIETEDLPVPIPLGDSDQLRVGQFVVALGNPFGLERTLTVGVISALSRVIQSPDGRFIGEAIQTDAAINPGNSGGPLLDLQGRVIGVNAQIISPAGASAGIGFAVSANTVHRVVPQLIAQGHYPHPWLGVSVLPFDAEGAQLLREAGMEVPVDKGLLVAEVVPDSPAARAGIHYPSGWGHHHRHQRPAHRQLPGTDRLPGSGDAGGRQGGSDPHPRRGGDNGRGDTGGAARAALVGFIPERPYDPAALQAFHPEVHISPK